jgi:hypothetical protein
MAPRGRGRRRATFPRFCDLHHIGHAESSLCRSGSHFGDEHARYKAAFGDRRHHSRGVRRRHRDQELASLCRKRPDRGLLQALAHVARAFIPGKGAQSGLVEGILSERGFKAAGPCFRSERRPRPRCPQLPVPGLAWTDQDHETFYLRDCGARYFNSVMTAKPVSRTRSSVCVRLPRLKRMSPDLYALTTLLPSGVVDFSAVSSS